MHKDIYTHIYIYVVYTWVYIIINFWAGWNQQFATEAKRKAEKQAEKDTKKSGWFATPIFGNTFNIIDLFLLFTGQ